MERLTNGSPDPEWTVELLEKVIYMIHVLCHT